MKEIKALCCLQAQAEAQSTPHNHLIIFNLITKVNIIYTNYNRGDYRHEYYHDCYGGTWSFQSGDGDASTGQSGVNQDDNPCARGRDK
jgi:hypothetical protein